MSNIIGLGNVYGESWVSLNGGARAMIKNLRRCGFADMGAPKRFSADSEFCQQIFKECLSSPGIEQTVWFFQAS